MSPSHYGMRWKGIKAGFNERFRLSVGAIRAPIPRRNWYNWRWSIGDRAARFKGRRLRLRQIQSVPVRSSHYFRGFDRSRRDTLSSKLGYNSRVLLSEILTFQVTSSFRKPVD